jgi:hypothetical protein
MLEAQPGTRDEVAHSARHQRFAGSRRGDYALTRVATPLHLCGDPRLRGGPSWTTIDLCPLAYQRQR